MAATAAMTVMTALRTVGALAWSIWDGRWTLRLGDYQGEPGAAWIGVLVSLATSTFLSLFGFYVVKGPVERDHRTGVGEILATTPISRFAYLLGKALSNFLVLAAMVAVLAVGAALSVVGTGSWSLGPLLAPLALLTLPVLALVAAVAVLFECVPGLRGALGNVLYFFLWGFALSLPIMTSSGAADPIGFQLVQGSLHDAVLDQYPDTTGIDGMSLTLADSGPAPAHRFQFRGIDWRRGLAGRAVWWAVALGLVLLAVPFFDRFDPSRRQRSGRRKSRGRRDEEAADPVFDPTMGASVGAERGPATEAAVVLTPLTSGSPKVFEGTFTALWFLGILNGLPALDFLGGGAAARDAGVLALYALATLPLLAAALAGQRYRAD